MIYSWYWINENLKFEMTIRDQLEKLIEEKMEYPDIKQVRPDKKSAFGYKQVILLLGFVAIAATWVDAIIK